MPTLPPQAHHSRIQLRPRKRNMQWISFTLAVAIHLVAISILWHFFKPVPQTRNNDDFYVRNGILYTPNASEIGPAFSTLAVSGSSEAIPDNPETLYTTIDTQFNPVTMSPILTEALASQYNLPQSTTITPTHSLLDYIRERKSYTRD